MLPDRIELLQIAFELAALYRNNSPLGQGYIHIEFWGYFPPWGFVSYRNDPTGDANGSMQWTGYTELIGVLVHLLDYTSFMVTLNRPHQTTVARFTPQRQDNRIYCEMNGITNGETPFTEHSTRYALIKGRYEVAELGASMDTYELGVGPFGRSRAYTGEPWV